VTIRAGLKETRNVKNYEARENKLVFLEDRILRAKTVYESLQLEIRSQGGRNNEEMSLYRDKARGYKETINELIQETNVARAEQGGVVMSTEQIMIANSEKFSTGQMLQQGITIQEKSIESLERQLRMIDESKQLATETLAELARQEEQLLKITDDVQTVRENLKYAGKQLRSIARRMAGDAAFRVCCIVMLVVVIIIIIIVAGRKKGLNGCFFFCFTCLFSCSAASIERNFQSVDPKAGDYCSCNNNTSSMKMKSFTQKDSPKASLACCFRTRFRQKKGVHSILLLDRLLHQLAQQLWIKLARIKLLGQITQHRAHILHTRGLVLVNRLCNGCPHLLQGSLLWQKLQQDRLFFERTFTQLFRLL
jgi:hypothetical protein